MSTSTLIAVLILSLVFLTAVRAWLYGTAPADEEDF